MSYDNINLQPTFKPIDNLFLNRLRQFTDGGRYKQLNLPKFYDYERVDSNSPAIDLKVWKVPDKDGKTDRPLFKDIDFSSIEWQNAKKGDNFGPSWKTFWFRIEWEIPEAWLDKADEVDFDWDCSNEGLIYAADGTPLQAFTGGGERTLYKIPKDYKKKGKQLFYLEVACNGMFGNGDGGVPDPNRYFRLNRCDLVYPDLDARKLYWDFWIIGDAARELGLGSAKYQAALVATEIMDTFDPQDRSSILKCRDIATRYLGKDRDSDEVYHVNPLNKIDVHAVGNCHIDTAWLWPFAETRRKIVRSWTTQLKIADEYPEYVFVASQMQQFKWLKEDHPEILEKIKDKFVHNQFLPIGGTWVENDTNMPGGESLIRQFLLGQRWLTNEFGTPATVFWLPDTFGYSSQIPQICQISGINKFLTQKLSWNNINSFPLSTFNWKAIDGSQVLVHMPPANTYTASANFGDVVRSQNQHKNLRDVPTGLLLYGHGDGGGGPDEEMLEKLRRCRGLANTSAAIPSVHVGDTVEEFYEEVLEKSDNGKTLPTWTGEIYLEFHRGTYTTQADVKKWMRFAEIKLHDVELLATLLSVTSDYEYPAAKIQRIWEDIALCQFHDVLPGSCIGMVYYDEVKPMLTKALDSLDTLLKELSAQFKSKQNTWTTINTLPWHRQDIVEVPTDTFGLCDISSDALVLEDDGVTKFVFDTHKNQAITKKELKYPASVAKVGDVHVLTNGILKASIDNNGCVTSLIDLKNGRELIDNTTTKQTTGVGNQFVLFDDEPLSFPAWDTEIYSLNKFTFLKKGEVVSISDHELESKIKIKHEISLQSYIETTISLQGVADEGNAHLQNNYLKFSCHVEWHEFYKFLKVQFPTTIYTPQFALYETQFGITQRPTHYNTTWDVAKFEVCHHKFMDLSEYNYGVSILNNSKYGASVHGNLMRLSLLRSAKAPDDKADMGAHDFEYAIYPHAGGLGPDVVRTAHNFNYKLLPCSGSSQIVRKVLRSVTLHGDKSLILSNIKRAENDYDVNTYKNIESYARGKKSIIVRVYESLGGSSRGKLRFKDLAVDKVYKTDAMEEDHEELDLTDNSVAIRLRGFEIATYRVLLK